MPSMPVLHCARNPQRLCMDRWGVPQCCKCRLEISNIVNARNYKWKCIHLQFKLYWTKSVECIVKCKKTTQVSIKRIDLKDIVGLGNLCSVLCMFLIRLWIISVEQYCESDIEPQGRQIRTWRALLYHIVLLFALVCLDMEWILWFHILITVWHVVWPLEMCYLPGWTTSHAIECSESSSKWEESND